MAGEMNETALAVMALYRNLERMVKMHDLMMQDVNHGASCYQATTIAEMNEAPVCARQALDRAKKQLDRYNLY